MARGRAGRQWREYLGAAAAVALTGAVCFGLRARLQTTDVAMLLLLAVVFVAARTRNGPALLATVLAIAGFDFVFVPPYYTFDVTEKAYFLTFGVMFAVALVMGRLTLRIREQAEETAERERRAAAELAMSRELADTSSRAAQLDVVARHLTFALGGVAAETVVAEPGQPFGMSWPAASVFESAAVRVAAVWAHEHGLIAGAGAPHCADAEAGVVPLRAAGNPLGIVVVSLPDPDHPPAEAAWRTAEALATAASVALERTLLAERSERARMEAEAERLRTALLSSLSHDLRTPLATIEGAASSLLESAAPLPQSARAELAESILEESRRMTSLVSNLLDMVRVASGSLAVKKEWQPLEEPVGVALLRLEDRLEGHPVTTRLPSDLPLVPVDELLIEQVFLNLLENAAKYTPAGTPIQVSAWQENGAVVVEVADRGPGIPPESRRSIFQKFFRATSADGPSGAGLGLAICEGIVTAHGGRIWVERGTEGGAAFRFTLPLDGPPVGAALADLAE